MNEDQFKEKKITDYLKYIPRLKTINLENYTERINQKKLIHLIEEEKAFRKNLYKELDKCETPYQELAFIRLFEFFPTARVEKWFWDKDNRKRWRTDIIIGNVVIEIDGSHHRFDDDQFNKDEEKDSFFFRKGYTVIRKSNNWVMNHFKEVPKEIALFLNNNREKIKKI